MKCNLIQTIVLTVFTLAVVSNAAMAQTSDEFNVYAQSAPQGVMLIVDGPALHPSSASQANGWIGYNLYRRAKSDTLVQRVTDKPLSRIGSLAELRAVAGDGINGLATFLGAKDTAALWSMIANGDEQIVSLEALLKSFRKLMGHLYVDTQVVVGSTYVYYGAEVDSAGNESAPSDTVEVTVGSPMFPLLGPKGVNVEIGDEQVTLRWIINPDDSGAFSYNVYRAADSAGYFQRLNREDILALRFGDADTLAPEMTFVDSTVYNQRTYYYAVVSADYAGNESPRNILPARAHDVTAPLKPENVLAQDDKNGIRLTWNKSEASDIGGYNIYRSLNPDSSFVKLNHTLSPTDSAYYVDYLATLHRDYYYRISAVDKAGNESERSALAVAMFHTPARPLPPNGVTATADTNAVSISWQIATDTLVRGYYIYRANRWRGDFTQVSPLLVRSDSLWTDTTYGLSSHGVYYYSLRSVTVSDQYSPYSEAVLCSPLGDNDEAPSPPQSFFGYADIDGNRLFWTPPQSAAGFGFNLYRYKADTADDIVLLNRTPLPLMTGHYTDTTVIDTYGSYTYLIRSITADNIEGQPSHPVTVSRATGELAPPERVRCSNYTDSVRISWNISQQDNVSGYRLYRRQVGSDVVLLSPDMLAKSISSFTDTQAHRGTRYYYSLATIGPDGAEGLRSPEIEILVR